MFPTRSSFPEAQPELCVTFFTCIGTNVAGTIDLERTYPAAVVFLEAQRSLDGTDVALRYELVWLDNGGDSSVPAEFEARGAQFDQILRNPTNEGLFRAVNDVWFRGRGCRAPYVISLEDDRVPRPDVISWHLPDKTRAAHLALAVGVLRLDPSIVGTRLKREWSDEVVAMTPGNDGTRRSAPMQTREGLRYRRHCMDLESGVVWGAFSMAAVVYDRVRLMERVGLLLEGPPHGHHHRHSNLRSSRPEPHVDPCSERQITCPSPSTGDR